MNDTLDRLLNAPLFTISRTPITAMTLLVAGVILLATWWLARLARNGLLRALTRRGVRDTGSVAAAARLLQYVVLLLGVGVALQTVGIDLGALFTAGAFFAVAIGFAMQNVAQNFVSGVILLVERTITPGDILEVDGRVVRVTAMGLRATVARSRDEEDLIIPNSTLVQSTVTNFTLSDSTYRIKATVGVSYGSDLERVMAALRRAADELPGRMAEFEPRILLTGFGNSSVDFEVLVWVDDPWTARAQQSVLNLAIWRELKAAEVTIPFPQLDLWVHQLPEVRLAGGGPAAAGAEAGAPG